MSQLLLDAYVLANCHVSCGSQKHSTTWFKLLVLLHVTKLFFIHMNTLNPLSLVKNPLLRPSAMRSSNPHFNTSDRITESMFRLLCGHRTESKKFSVSCKSFFWRKEFTIKFLYELIKAGCFVSFRVGLHVAFDGSLHLFSCFARRISQARFGKSRSSLQIGSVI